jgi:hypothetical protein
VVVRLENITQYKIIRELGKSEHVTSYLVEDEGKGYKGILRIIQQIELKDAWFDVYEEYGSKVTNYKYLPKCINIDSCPINGTFSVLLENDGDFLKEHQPLENKQINQLIDALWHLHKKEFIHGNMIKENIWVKENGDLTLYGAGEYKVFTSGHHVTIEDDIRQLLSLIANHTVLSSTFNLEEENLSLDNVRNWVQEKFSEPIPSVEEEKEIVEENEEKPGLIEKPSKEDDGGDEWVEKKEEVILQRIDQVPDSIQDLESEPQKQKRKYWLFALAGIALILFTVASFSWIHQGKEESLHNDSKKTSQVTMVNQNDTNIKEKESDLDDGESSLEPNLSQFHHLFPEWTVIKGSTVQFGSTEYTVVAVGQSRDDFSGALKVAVLSKTPEDKWTKISETPEYETFLSEPELYIGSLLTLNPQGGDTALIVFDIPSGGSAGFVDVIALSVHHNGAMEEMWSGFGFGIKMDSNSVSVEEIGEKKLSLINGKFSLEEIPRSEVAPSNAKEVLFDINELGQVVPVEEKKVSMKVGDSIAFIPANEEVKRKFDLGEITLYTNANIGGKLTLSNSNMYQHGNYVQFNSPGKYEFVLEYYEGQKMDSDNPDPTFITVIAE